MMESQLWLNFLRSVQMFRQVRMVHWPEEKNQRDPGRSMVRNLQKPHDLGNLEDWTQFVKIYQKQERTHVHPGSRLLLWSKICNPPIRPWTLQQHLSLPNPYFSHSHYEAIDCSAPHPSPFLVLEETRSCCNQNEMSNFLKPEELL